MSFGSFRPKIEHVWGVSTHAMLPHVVRSLLHGMEPNFFLFFSFQRTRCMDGIFAFCPVSLSRSFRDDYEMTARGGLNADGARLDWLWLYSAYPPSFFNHLFFFFFISLSSLWAGRSQLITENGKVMCRGGQGDFTFCVNASLSKF